MVIKILGSGCRKCLDLKENVLIAVKELHLDAEIVIVEDLLEIIKYGVMTTPALVIDDKVEALGRVLKPKEIIKLLNMA